MPESASRDMLSKRSLGCERRELPVAKRFRANLSDLFLSNAVGASRMASLAADAAGSGSRGVDDFARAGSGPNAHRNLMRRLLKGPSGRPCATHPCVCKIRGVGRTWSTRSP